jgi:hypothetical protein
MTAASSLETLAGIAAMVRRLRPDWRDAEAFYELRSEIVGALLRLARQPAQVPTPVRPPPPQTLTITRHVVVAASSSLPRALRASHRLRRHRYPRPPSCSSQGAFDLSRRS